VSDLNYRQWIGNAAIVLAFIGSSSLVTWGLVHEYAKPQDPFKDVETKLAKGIIEDTSMGTGQGQSRQTSRTRTATAQPTNNVNQGRTANNARGGQQGGGQQGGGRGNNTVTARGGRGGRGGGGGGGGGGAMDPGAADMGGMGFAVDSVDDGG
jgi:hypothetical protein